MPHHVYFMKCLCCFLQKKECYTGLATLETLICTKERRGLAHRAVPSYRRSPLRYTAEAAVIIKASSSRQENKFLFLNTKIYLIHEF